MIRGLARIGLPTSADSRSDVLLEALEVLSAESRAGAPPALALRTAASMAPGVLDRGAFVAGWGGDVVLGLRADAACAERSRSSARGQHRTLRRAGALIRRRSTPHGAPCDEVARAVRELSDVWGRVVSDGTGLADAVDALHKTLTDNAVIRQELSGHLAAPRATGVVLAALPVLGIGLGELLGAGSLSWLTGSQPGRIVVLVAAALDLTGLAWTARIAHRIESQL